MQSGNIFRAVGKVPDSVIPAALKYLFLACGR